MTIKQATAQLYNSVRLTLNQSRLDPVVLVSTSAAFATAQRIKEFVCDTEITPSLDINPANRFYFTKGATIVPAMQSSLVCEFPTFLTFDLDKFDLPEGVDIVLNMQEDFLREGAYAGSDGASIPRVPNLISLRTPKKLAKQIMLSSTLFDFDYLRLRPLDSLFDSLFTPDFFAVATKVGEILMPAVIVLDSEPVKTTDIQLTNSAVSQVDAEALAILQLNFNTFEIDTAINTNGGLLLIAELDADSITNISAAAETFKGISNENFAAETELEPDYERFRGYQANFNTVAESFIDTELSRIRGFESQAATSTAFAVEVDEFPFALQFEVDLEDTAVNGIEKIAVSQFGFFVNYQRNDGLFNLEFFDYSQARRLSQIAYDPDNLSIGEVLVPNNLVGNDFVTWNPNVQGWAKYQGAGLALIIVEDSFSNYINHEAWDGIVPWQNQDGSMFVFATESNDSSFNNSKDSAKILYHPLIPDQGSDATKQAFERIFPDFTDVGETSEWGQIAVLDDNSKFLAEIVFETYSEIHLFDNSGTNNYTLLKRYTSQDLGNTNTKNLFGFILAAANQTQDIYSFNDLDSAALTVSQPDIRLGTNHYFFYDTRFKAVTMPGNNPIQTITDPVQPLIAQADSQTNTDRVFLFNSNNKKLLVYKDVR